ncbi:probable BOI-related E3 ubiquitin-protein ligase 2 [Lotus japonicus]|uniref:probable BOI-related E3 ubiquitin-protein ligase 2 n=1 Tax=Lotus japonicus TaxID=34305 RepID=UPI002588DD8F|nr:probable BOI-related E3 ubiquitin-protein ligase 2 [Lotus japonicus]
MAIETHHLNLFPPHFIPNRETIITNPIDSTFVNMYNANNYSSLLPHSATTTTASETLFPAAPQYASFIADSPAAMKSDSTLTYNHHNTTTATSNGVPFQRKRSRDAINNNNYLFSPYKNTSNNAFSFLGEDISLHIHHHQLDIDNLISQHMEKVRMELEEKRKGQVRRLMEAIEIGMMKRLKTKEDEIERIGKLNLALEERVKSLYIENQIWRELAQTNEATANALRANLEHALCQIRDSDDEDATVVPPAMAAPEDDAESCCGSNNDDDGWRTVVQQGVQDKECGGPESDRRRRLCRKCGKEESCVLILPCRHLCVCTLCGSTLHNCPICKSYKNASVHVNMT